MATKITSSSNAATTTNMPSTSLTSSLASKFLTSYSSLGHENLNIFPARSSEKLYTKHQSSNCKTEFSLSNLTQMNAHNTNKLHTTLNDENKSKPFRLNDLVWAKLKNFPWWPCQIVRDLVDNNEYFKIIGNKEMYLVEMIGAFKERAWVSQSSLFKYKGIESFKTYAQDQVDRAETKLEKERLAERFQLKVSPTRRDDWDQSIVEADLIIKKNELEEEENKFNDFNHRKNLTLKLKRKRDNDEIASNEDETDRIKIKYSKIDFNNNSNLKSDFIEQEEDEALNGEAEDDNESEDEEEEELESTTSDEEDSDSFQPTTIYDIEQPIQNIYTYNNNATTNANTNNNINSLKANTYSEDEYQQMHSINSIMTELENNHIKSKTISKNQPSHNNSVLFNETTNNNLSCSYSVENLNNRHQQANNELVDVTKKKKRGRKPKQTNDIENNTLINNKNSPFSTGSSSSSGGGSSTSSNQSSPSNSRKNSADLTHNLNGKKQNKFTSLADYVITQSSSSNEGNTNFSKSHKKNETSKSKHTFDQNQQLNELLLKDSKDFDLNLNDFINPRTTSSREANMNSSSSSSAVAETYLIDRYKYAVRHIRQGLSVEEACNKYRISKGALLKCLSGGTAPRGKKTRLTETEENEIVEWLINNKDVKYNEAIHLVFEQVEQIFQQTQRPNPFNNGKPSMDWWYDFLSRHPQIMASKPDWLRRGKVNDQYIRDVQSGQLKCTKFRRALLSAIQYIKSLSDAENAHPNGNGDASTNFVLNEKLAVKKESAKSSDLFGCDTTTIYLKNNAIKAKSLTKTNKISNNNIINNKTDSTVFHQQQQQQQQQNQIKPRQTMNSISTTIDSPSKLINNKKPEFNASRSVLNTNGAKTDNLIENAPNLVDYTDDDLESITNMLERSTNGKLDSSNVSSGIAVRFDDSFLSANHHHQNLLITDDLNGPNGFVYDSVSTATNGIQNQDSSIFLNDHYNSIHDDDEQTDDDEFDDQRAYIQVDPSRFI